jgi:hypothetical protein
MNKILENHEERFYTKLLLQNKKIKRRRQIRYFSIAATLALLIALPLYLFLENKTDYVAESPLNEEVQDVINTYQARLDAEIAEIRAMSCYAKMEKELSEIQKNSLPADELAALPIEKQLYYIKKIYKIKFETVQYMQSMCI